MAFTLHQGDAQQTFVEHPMEVARRALHEAADFAEKSRGMNAERWAAVLRRFAESIPPRDHIVRAADGE